MLLVGNPNVGKSTMFNRLTGGNQTEMNAPGTTVDLHIGTWRATPYRLVDLPGTYSLLARSPDEAVAARAVAGDDRSVGVPDLAVVLLDATALSRSFVLLAQVAQAGVPVVAAVSMADVAARRGIAVDEELLTSLLGIPVVVVNPRAGVGVDRLSTAVNAVLADPTPRGLVGLDTSDNRSPETAADDLFEWVARTARDLAVGPVRRTWTDRLDILLLNAWIGIPVFLAILWAVFQLTTVVVAPAQDWLDTFVGGTVAGGISTVLARVGLAGGWFESFLVDGLLAGVATVATFVPLMSVMFAALAILEDSGYLARAAVVADRGMRALGLDGRAVLPLVIGFGCNVPALAATKTLPSARQRLLTGLLVPLTSCSARLVVYLLIASIFFPDHAGTVVFGMYVVSVGLVIGAGLLLRRTAFSDVTAEPLMLSLPAYQVPRILPLLQSVWLRVRMFLVRAGRIVVATLAVIWLLQAVPVTSGHDLADVPVTESAYGAVAQAGSALFEPAGFGDWRLTGSLMAGFVAKEVVVGSLAQSYAVGEPTDPTAPGDLGTQLTATLTETSGGHPQAAALAYLVFVLAYTPCAATVAEQRRLFGWRPTLAALGAQLVFAWMLAVLVFQVGRLL